VIDYAVREVATLGKYTASHGGLFFWHRWQVFVFRPALGMNIDRFYNGMGFTLVR
jgi:hypothetical protein